MRKELILLPSCHSTNDEAARMACAGSAEGVVVASFDQTNGRGQRGTIWESEPHKNIAASFILRPVGLPLVDRFKIHISLALSICDLIWHETGIEALIKWPNDIYLGDQKVGGVLLESSIADRTWEYVIAGIGLNVNQSYFRTRHATSLFQVTGVRYEPLARVLDALVEAVHERYEQMILGGIDQKPSYLKRLYRYQEMASYCDLILGKGFEGMILGVGRDGRLAVHSEGTTKYFDVKELRFL